MKVLLTYFTLRLQGLPHKISRNPSPKTGVCPVKFIIKSTYLCFKNFIELVRSDFTFVTFQNVTRFFPEDQKDSKIKPTLIPSDYNRAENSEQFRLCSIKIHRALFEIHLTSSVFLHKLA